MDPTSLAFIALMVVAFYFLILRPQKKRQQAVQRTLAALEPGDRVLLGSGLFGTIVSLGDRQAVLEISPGVELTVLKQAIIRAATEADEDTVVDELDDDELDDLDATAPMVDPSTSGSSSTGAHAVEPRTDRPHPSAGADNNRLG